MQDAVPLPERAAAEFPIQAREGQFPEPPLPGAVHPEAPEQEVHHPEALPPGQAVQELLPPIVPVRPAGPMPLPQQGGTARAAGRRDRITERSL